mmetsp:Transcript_17526/g.52590  ORF Transcript_17526/g.52590 Transcript_17526/m.52590 type:complete len:687 (+) Transcript_17526:397-2457(+)
MGRPGRRPSRKDFKLLREDAAEDDIFDPEEAARRRKAGTTRGMLRLFALAREEVWVLLLATVMLLVGSLAAVAVPKLAGQLLDICINISKFSTKRDAETRANEQLVEIIIILAVGGVASGLRAWLFNGAAERVMARLRARLFRHLMSQELGFFDRVRTGELMNRLSEDTRLMKSAGTVSISVALRSLTVAALGLGLMFHTSVVLTGLTLAVLPLMLIAFQVYARFNRHYTSQSLTSSAQAAVVAEECFGSIRTVRSFGKEGAACLRYKDAVLRTQSWGLKSAFAGGLFTAFNGTVAPGAIMAVLWWGARLVINGHLSAGQLSSFVVYAIFVSGNVGQLAGVFSSLMQAVGASERVFELLDRAPLMDQPHHGRKPTGQPEGGHIKLQNVWFAYPSRPGAAVLRGVSIDLPPGSKAALVGPSGGGKSTVVNLIERFYEPSRGQILLDGTPLDAIDHEHLHTQISLVSQEPVLFAETIRFNITFGLPGGDSSVTQEEVEAAARVANAHDFIASFPQGYATSVGERGVRLSGGQKQRIAIARALLCNPRVLLLDEATSALDAESEGLVQQALERVSAGRTVLIIAHRLSTVQGSDQVLVVSDGIIAEKGTHSELLQRGGTYATLVRRQLMGGVSTEALSLSGGPPATIQEGVTESSDSDAEDNGVSDYNTDGDTLGTGGGGSDSEAELKY